jgi:hypothetical protein
MPEDIWGLLRIPNVDEDDMQHAIFHAEQMIYEDHGRAQQAMETELLQWWITTPGSTRLLIHGDFEHAEAVSSFSVLAAVLTLNLRSSGNYIGLVFFCGRHLAWDRHQGPLAMIRSLIAQILRQLPAQYVHLDPQLSRQEIEDGDVQALCKLFAYLLRQVPLGTPVMCFIDGINFYEADQYFGDMETVILSLTDLVDDSQSMGNSFKLLLICPRPTVEVRRIFDPDLLVHMESIPRLERGLVLGDLQKQFSYSPTLE